VRTMPPEATQTLFADLQAVGTSLAEHGKFDREAIKRIAQPESFPAIMGPVFRVFLRLPGSHSYFDNMMKKNGTLEKRFARPFSIG
jgi:hypothetical protein